ncbi:mitochondrial protein [Spathaspora passalidarum NRRL Y-27907]|uniref:SURF1-like protein n=1 Tax=Spathaspora passalidarum (strain NRRL Y-27907 / 11-Y1) TaxID=619300 RepID=G3ATM8_SPAPN|nr:mitochondrial protein [Spathaspora passalidarum NRRL Y-27907]EGW30991.1 mitochondrial protein [Spathaspora passalidarum NRRL Y-27907]
MAIVLLHQLKQFQRSVKTSTLDWKPIKSVSGNLSLLEQQAKSPKLRAFFLGLMLAMPIISFWLGCWQVKRLKWKTDLIAKCENALAQPSMDDLPAVLDPSVIPDFEYRKFKVKGHFDYDNEMFLGPRIKDGVAGYLVVTPFVRSSGGKPILIERGWIHKDMVIPERRKTGYLSHLAMPQGEIEIEALFRIMPTRSSIQFEHEMGSRVFHFPDVPAMAEQSGSLPIYCQMIYDLRDHIEWKKEKKDDNTSKKKSSILGLLVHSKDQNVTDDDAFIAKLAEQDETLQFQEFEFIKEGVPIAATPKIKLNNNHMQYLVTWFGVSFASTILLLYNVWKTRQFSSADKIIAAKRQGKI